MIRLDEIINSMQKGDIALSDSAKLFEEGMTLVMTMEEELGNVKANVQVLLEKYEKPKFGDFDEN
jgi:exodeoxyribonuclease VII small subunit